MNTLPQEVPVSQKQPAAEEACVKEKPETAAKERHVTRRFRKPLLWVCGLTAAIIAVLLMYQPLWGVWTVRDVTAHFTAELDAQGRVDLNTADVTALCTLPGIGQSKAAAIVAWREANGPFSTVEELLQVSGIGEKTLENLREHICITQND